MEHQPKKLITRILEFAVLFALAAYLIRLGVCYILIIWPVLVILAVVTVVIIAIYRVWKNRTNVKW